MGQGLTFELYALVVVFALIMYSIVFLLRKRYSNTRSSFYVANRKIGIFPGSFSVAVSWVWAPALFVSSSIAYDLGLPGALWFIIPNVACFFIFAPVAVKFRQLVPEGYTLYDYFKKRYPNKHSIAQLIALTSTLFAMAAIVENLVAISKLYNFYTGQTGWHAIIVMSVISLGYSLIGGLKISVITDVVQMLMVIVIGFILLPWVFHSADTPKLTVDILFGKTGDSSWLAVAFAPGLSLLFGLIGGPLSDQMFFQRAMAVSKDKIKKTMFRAGLIFAIVPILLSTFGFLGVALGEKITVNDSELVAAIIIRDYLPQSASLLFLLMLISGLASTLDSAYCACGSLYGRAFIPTIVNKIDEKKELLQSRLFMILIALISALIASVSRDIWYVFMTDAAIASAGIVPVLLSVFYKKQKATSTYWSLFVGLIAGIVISILGHFWDLNTIAALGAPIGVFLGLIISLIINTYSKTS